MPTFDSWLEEMLARDVTLLCAADGTALGQGTTSYQVSTPHAGWAEASPEHWWRVTCAAVRAAAGPAPAEVVGLAVAGQMHGLVLCAERSVARALS